MTQEPLEDPVSTESVDPHQPPQYDSFSAQSLGQRDPAHLSVSGWISWLVIGAFTVFVLANTTLQQFGKRDSKTVASQSDLMQINLQAKMIVGQKAFSAFAQEVKKEDDSGPNDADVSADTVDGDASVSGDLGNQAPAAAPAVNVPPPNLSALDTGSYEQRLCNAAILHEVQGPQTALDYLDELDAKVSKHDFQRSDDQVAMEASVRRLMENYRAGNSTPDVIDAQQQQRLQDRLGFSAELLLNPPNAESPEREKLELQSQTAAVAAVVGLILAVLFFLFGIVSLLFILTYVLTGSSPSQFVAQNDAHNVYAETFALWLVSFFGSQFLVGYFNLLKTDAQRMIANPIFFFVSLLVLGWPVLRGIGAAKVFADIGWTPKQTFRNTLLSIPSYAAWLPAVMVGFFIVFMLMLAAPLPTAVGEFAVPSTPGHPIQKILSGGDTLTWATMVIAACVAAPIVEETMFRGVLYRHLRGLSMKYGKTFSILISALVNGVIFASLHPQGILAVPLLTTLAIGFSFVREWRDSLWTSILMHAFNNSMVTLVILFLL